MNRAAAVALLAAGGAAASPIKTAKDLNGKVIGVNGVRNISEIDTRTWVDKNGGNSSTVQFVELTFPEMAPAVLSGRVAAAELRDLFVTGT
jgi:NitT/TauT family transport system substrate-binding protein